MFRSVFILLFFHFAITASAQKYRTAGGVRFETDRLGFTAVHRVLERTTLEAIGMGSQREITSHVLARQHFPLLGKRINVYFGGGLHVGDHKDHGTYFGFDLITGVEYKVNALPLLISFDFKPAVHYDHEDWLTPSTAFSLRYVFLKEKKKEGGFLDRLFPKKNEKNDR